MATVKLGFGSRLFAAMSLLLSASFATMPGCTSESLSARTTHFTRPVTFDVVDSEFVGNDLVSVDAVWSKESGWSAGGQCWIHGRYRLSEAPQGTIVVSYGLVEFQTIPVAGREGEFDFLIRASWDGSVRVSLFPSDSGPGEYVGGWRESGSSALIQFATSDAQPRPPQSAP